MPSQWVLFEVNQMTRNRVGRSRIIYLFILLVVLLPPAHAPGEGRAETISESRAKSRTFAIVYPIAHPFFEPVTEQAIEYGKRRGVEIIAGAPEGKNVAQQIQIMENLISMKVDGIALCATEPGALAPWVDKAIAAGIPTIAFESDIPGSGRICFLGTDNYRAGQHLAEVLGRELTSGGEVIVCTGLSTQMSLTQRIEGIRWTLHERFPLVRIVDLRTGEGDPGLTVSVIESQIRDHPGFGVFTSIDATGGPAAVSIWKAKGWKGDRHRIITFDDMPENLAGIRAGIVRAVVSQKQWTWGPLIIDRLIDIIEGNPVPDYHDTGTVEITLANIESYRSEPESRK